MLEEDKYMAFYKDFEEALYLYNGRPHWGKINFIDYEKAQKIYGINLQKYIDVKRRLDPNGVFSNPFTDRVLKG
jgi:L-gulonolactone oxidase